MNGCLLELRNVKSTIKSELKRLSTGQNLSVAETILEENRPFAKNFIFSIDKLYSKFDIKQACKEICKII